MWLPDGSFGLTTTREAEGRGTCQLLLGAGRRLSTEKARAGRVSTVGCSDVVRNGGTAELRLMGAAFEVTNRKEEAFPSGPAGNRLCCCVCPGWEHMQDTPKGFPATGNKIHHPCHLSVQPTSSFISTRLLDRLFSEPSVQEWKHQLG